MGYKENSITNPFLYITKQIRKFYLNSSIYNTKISKIFDGGFEYIPHLKIFDCIVKVKDRRNRIEDYDTESIWENQNLLEKDFKKLHSFFWLFTIDLKSSKKITRSVISNWTNLNQNYNSKSWELDTLSKRVISWIANSNNFYHEGNEHFKMNFTKISLAFCIILFIAPTLDAQTKKIKRPKNRVGISSVDNFVQESGQFLMNVGPE